MMRPHRGILIACTVLTMFSVAGCDDPAASQPNAVQPSDVSQSESTSAPAPEPAAFESPVDDKGNNQTADSEVIAVTEGSPQDAAPKDVKPAESAPETRTMESRPARRPFRRPPPGGEVAPPPQPRVVRATRAANSGGVTEITFDTIKFDIEPGDPFERDMITEDIEKLFGKKVRIRGYIYPPFQQAGIKRFVLVRDNMECCFGPGAALYDCVAVEMVEGKTIDYTVRPVAVEGTLRLNEVRGLGGEHLSVFYLDGIKVR